MANKHMFSREELLILACIACVPSHGQLDILSVLLGMGWILAWAYRFFKDAFASK